MNRPRSILDAFQALARNRGMEAPNVSVETSSLDFLKSLLKGSTLLAALPRGAVHVELAGGSLKSLEMADLPRVEVAFVHRHGVMSPLTTQILHQVEELVRSLD